MLASLNRRWQFEHGTTPESDRKRTQPALHNDVVVLRAIVSPRFLHQPLQLG